MTVHRYAVYGAVAWVPLLVYFGMTDRDAVLLSLILTPVLALLLVASVKSGHLVLTIFMAFCLISHAVAPPFFFLRRQFYTYGGDFGAVKDFRFGVGEFLSIYVWVLIFLTAVVAMSVLLFSDRSAVRQENSLTIDIGGKIDVASRERNGQLLALFILTIALPVSWCMYRLHIGITGLEPPVLPYRMTGILTYFRLFVVPLAIFIGFGVSRRSWQLTTLVLVYAFIAGFAGSSRYLVLTAIAPLLVFAILERRPLRVAMIVSLASIAFVLVTATRDYVYSRNLTLPELMSTTVSEYDVSQFSPFEIVGGIANRLWGPQDVVLAYQYRVPDRFAAIREYFSNRTVVEDLGYEFYGMKFSGAAAAFGVGIGYVAWMILLANRSVSALVVLAFITVVLLGVSERVVREYRSSSLRFWSVGSQPVAFLLVYCVYTSSLNWWADAMIAALGGLGIERIIRSRRRRSREVALRASQ